MTSTPSSAPAAGAEPAGHAPAEGGRNPDPLSGLIEKGLSKGWGALKSIMGYTRGLVEGVFVAGGALAGVDLRGGPGLIERVEHTRAFVEKTVGRAVGFTAGLPVRIIEHPLKATKILWNALLGRSLGSGGNAAPAGAEHAPAH